MNDVHLDEPFRFTPLEWLKIVGAAVTLIAVGYALFVFAAAVSPPPTSTTSTRPLTPITTQP